MTNKEAIRRIREHMIIHMLNEPQAIFITEALNLAITALEERSQGDLISRSALKEVIKANHYLLSAKNNSTDYGMFTTGIMQAIDNAPAVEINTNDIEYKAYCKGLEDGKKIARPQGEWLLRKGDENCMDEDAKQASIPYTYNAPQHDWKCGYPDITRGKGDAE